MWQRLAHIDPEVLANYLRNEYPQTVAVILSRIRPDHAARVLSILPDEFAIDVVNRMLKIDNVQKEALEHIEETLKSEFVTTFTQSAPGTRTRPWRKCSTPSTGTPRRASSRPSTR